MKVTSPRDVPDAMRLQTMAALECGHHVELDTVRFEQMLFIGDFNNRQHYHPFTNFSQCLDMVSKADAYFAFEHGRLVAGYKGVSLMTDCTTLKGHAVIVEACALIINVLAGAYDARTQ